MKIDNANSHPIKVKLGDSEDGIYANTHPIKVKLEGGGGGGGTSDFNELSNRPKYDGETMSGSTDIPNTAGQPKLLTSEDAGLNGYINPVDLEPGYYYIEDSNIYIGSKSGPVAFQVTPTVEGTVDGGYGHVEYDVPMFSVVFNPDSYIAEGDYGMFHWRMSSWSGGMSNVEVYRADTGSMVANTSIATFEAFPSSYWGNMTDVCGWYDTPYTNPLQGTIEHILVDGESGFNHESMGLQDSDSGNQSQMAISSAIGVLLNRPGWQSGLQVYNRGFLAAGYNKYFSGLDPDAIDQTIATLGFTRATYSYDLQTGDTNLYTRQDDPVNGGQFRFGAPVIRFTYDSADYNGSPCYGFNLDVADMRIKMKTLANRDLHNDVQDDELLTKGEIQVYYGDRIDALEQSVQGLEQILHQINNGGA